jgi:DNA-binding NtrC family response regulator
MAVSTGINHHPVILVVEDDADMRALLQDELTDEGYRVCQAVDGVDAAQKLAHEAETGGFDVIITDLKMPRMSGMDVLTIATERCPGVPVIAVTAYTDAPEFVKTYHSRFFACLRKPVKMAELKTAVQAALQQRRN